MIYTSRYDSPVGELLLAARNEALIGLWIEGQKYYPEALIHDAVPCRTPVLALTEAWLDRYFAGQAPRPKELPLSPDGSDFRQEVWKVLCEIPYGQVATYSQIAKRMGKARMSAQAVGGAVGHNPISIIIPCHRVVGASGSLTGYAGGIERKQFLLAHEGVELSRFYAPK